MFKPYTAKLHSMPGGVTCESCGWVPEDAWDTSPEGFYDIERACLCEPCFIEEYCEPIIKSMKMLKGCMRKSVK